MVVGNTPHQTALRKGRVNIAGAWYSVTSCIDKKRNLLVRDPFHPFTDIRPAIIVENGIRWLHEHNRWICKGYVVMPNHIHIIFVLCEEQTLSKVVSAFGKFTARKINELHGCKGRVWQHGFYDHCLRNKDAYERHLRYIYENPVRKGWVQSPEDWPFSSINPDW